MQNLDTLEEWPLCRATYLHGRNRSILKAFIGSFSLGGANELNTATAASNSFPPFPPWTSTARPNAVDRITSIVILLYSLNGGRACTTHSLNSKLTVGCHMMKIAVRGQKKAVNECHNIN